jgi:cation:H+ antiporter
MLLPLGLVVVGLALLIWASSHFVTGAARIAAILRVSMVVVGALIIGFGTSAPELLVSFLAASQGHPEVAYGNIIGSNLANLTLVLGMISIAFTMQITAGSVRKEGPISVASVIIFAILVQGGVQFWEGIVLSVMAGGASAFLIVASRGDATMESEVAEYVGNGDFRLRTEGTRTFLGLIGTLAGAQMLVEGATRIAELTGASEGFVGFTLVALGTSLPEVVTGIQAARKGESDLVVGNLLGSNLFNSLAVAGVAGIAGPTSSDLAIFGAPVIAMVVVSIAAWLMVFTGRRITKVEGIILLAAYAVVLPLASG